MSNQTIEAWIVIVTTIVCFCVFRRVSRPIALSGSLHQVLEHAVPAPREESLMAYACPWCSYSTDSARALVQHLALSPASHDVLAELTLERINTLVKAETYANVLIVAAETSRTVSYTVDYLLRLGLRAYLETPDGRKAN
jgi:hypothetical protein